MESIGGVMLAAKLEKNSRGVRHDNVFTETSTAGVYDPSLSLRHWGREIQRQTATTKTTLNQALRGPKDWEPLKPDSYC